MINNTRSRRGATPAFGEASTRPHASADSQLNEQLGKDRIEEVNNSDAAADSDIASNERGRTDNVSEHPGTPGASGRTLSAQQTAELESAAIRNLRLEYENKELRIINELLK
ncbi:MAG: hypothetical protein Q9223_007208, partial [Gallowayella weberi]